MELAHNYSGCLLEVGTDEAGRGCLAGPVVAAAVILPEKTELDLLNDSKKLTTKQRAILRPQIEQQALAYAVSFVWPEEIDKINILQSSIRAMHQAIDKLKLLPEFIIVDGNKFNSYKNIPHQTIVKGDGKYLSIAAASVLAKTYRDEYMEKIHRETPQYGWDKNKGYPTKAHRAAILAHGITSHHRKTFKLVPIQLHLDLT
ncbi:ribonuclease HII [Flavobacteriaceae bacterium F08102]|nr:ribonuclease HII [Flavobacteriaceae bacterium F08102]